MIGIKRHFIYAIAMIVLMIPGLIIPAAVRAEVGSNLPPYFTYPESVQTFNIIEGDGLSDMQAEDPDGDALTYHLTFGDLPPGIMLNVDGSFEGIAGNPERDAYIVAVEVRDGRGGIDTEELIIVVQAVNDAPEFTGAASNYNQIILVGQGLADLEVYDQDGDALTFSITSGTLPAGISMNEDGSFTGAAEPSTAGAYSVGVSVSDGNMGVDETILNIIVNRLPSFTGAASNTSQTIGEGQGLTAMEAIDPDSDSLSFSMSDGTLPEGISLNPNGSFSGTATFFSAGAYSSTIVVKDVYEPVTQTILSITVNEVNRYPTYTSAAENTSQTIKAGQGMAALTAVDQDNDTLTYSLVSGELPSWITLNSNGSFSGTTGTSSQGTFTSIISVSDGKGGTASTTLTVTITRTSSGDDDDGSLDNDSGNSNNANNNVVLPTNPSNLPGVVYNDTQVVGANKPVNKIQEELQLAGIRDVSPTDWFAGSVTVIVQAGLLKPTADGMFHPEARVSFEEGISVFAKVLGIAAKDDTPAQAVAKMQEARLLGYGISTSQDMKRVGVARLLGQVLGVAPKVINTRDQYPFADFDEVTPEDRGIIKAMYELGIFKGYMDGDIRTFRPDSVLTRAELALLIDRILGAH